MQAALHLTTTVRPDGTIEVSDSQLPPGEPVEVIILLPHSAVARRSVVEILSEAPGGLLFHTPKDVEDYVREERGSWER
jgi:hypothetical protein